MSWLVQLIGNLTSKLEERNPENQEQSVWWVRHVCAEVGSQCQCQCAIDWPRSRAVLPWQQSVSLGTPGFTGQHNLKALEFHVSAATEDQERNCFESKDSQFRQHTERDTLEQEHIRPELWVATLQYMQQSSWPASCPLVRWHLKFTSAPLEKE